MSSGGHNVPVAVSRGGTKGNPKSNNNNVKKPKALKTRSSRSVCQERYGCKGPTAALFSCSECKTLQCEACETLLHENSRFQFHERTPIPEVPQALICQSKACKEGDANYCDVVCIDCGDIRLCHSCDYTTHSAPPCPQSVRKHSRTPFSSIQEANLSPESTAKVSCSPSSNKISLKQEEPIIIVETESETDTRISKKQGSPSTGSSKASKKSKKKAKKEKQRQKEEDVDLKDSDTSSPGDEFEEQEEGKWSPSSFDGCPLPDIAQMSLDPPNGLDGGDDDDYFQTTDFDTSGPSSLKNNKKGSGLKKNSKKIPSSVVSSSSSTSTSTSNHQGNGKVSKEGPSKKNNCKNNCKKEEEKTSCSVTPASSSEDDNSDRVKSSFLVLDENEQMQINCVEDFAKKLGCCPDSQVKVVSIFGNTGEGKSHTLNFTFFGGEEVFKTSPAQSSCTIGIWAAYDRKNRVITIDTEGLLGVSENNNRRTRLLLKVLAISDVIIYRTRAERLHNDLFSFLGDASRAYGSHFHTELREASKRSGQCYTPTDLGPVVVIFHETLHTKVLQRIEDKSPEDELRRRFLSLNLTTESYSAFEYVGTQTQSPPTSFRGLQAAMRRHLNNTMVRSPRKVSIVFGALKHLNEKFSGDIEKTIANTFPDEYFTCSSHCESCGCRCTRSLNHHRDGLSHFSDAKCKYQHQFDNKVYYCKACNERGDDVLVVPKTSSCNDSTMAGLVKYAWSGYILECKRCGIIYKSREYWYGNPDPYTKVHTVILHIWPGDTRNFQGTQNAAQKVLDGLQYITSTAQSISAGPTRQITSWMADQVAPSYWVPNSRITHCRLCEIKFEDTDYKHHCRACGDGFCDDCSSKRCQVPDKGWPDPVRVCDRCYDRRSEFKDLPLRRRDDEEDEDYEDSVSSSEAYSEPVSTQEILLPRKAAEVISSTLGNVASAMEVPITWIKDSARPEYWEADKDIQACCVCESSFQEKKLTIHHCRACGKGVCDPCSQTKKTVASRGWDNPVRVCDTCAKKPSL